MVISPNGTNAPVVLDGTRSSDPEGEAITFAWYEGTTLLGTKAVVVTVMPVGEHPLLLVVSDGFLSATNAFTIDVLTTGQGVERLAAIVSADVSRSQPLLALLGAAAASINRGDTIPAINQLRAFEQKLRAQLGVSTEHEPGAFEWAGAVTPGFQSRFYRVVRPSASD